MNYEMETMREIWPEKGSGEHIEVGPDRDGLRLVEIRQIEFDGRVSARIALPVKVAVLVAKAVKLCGEELNNSSQDN